MITDVETIVSQKIAKDNTVHYVSAPVVSLQEIHTMVGSGVLNTVRTVVVTSKTVITPSVRDELRNRGIQIRRSMSGRCFSEYTDSPSSSPSLLSSLPSSPTSVAEKGTLVEKPETSHKRQWWCFSHQLHKTAINSVIPQVMAAAKRLRLDCLFMEGSEFNVIFDTLQQTFCQAETAAILLTHQSALAVCLANRVPLFRAILAVQPEQVAEDSILVGANLMVADPNRLAPFRLVQCCGRFWKTM